MIHVIVICEKYSNIAKISSFHNYSQNQYECLLRVFCFIRVTYVLNAAIDL